MLKLRFSLLLVISLYTHICSLLAQSPPCNRATYTEFINKGQELVGTGDYIEAFRYYKSAKDYCPEESATVERLIEGIIQRIADDQAETKQALAQAEKLVDAIYFYHGRYAVVYGEKDFTAVYYFINKNGDEVKKLGRWATAIQFDPWGLAKVSKKGVDFLLDTFGRSYPVAYQLSDLTSDKTALDLRGKRLDQFPTEIFAHPQLRVLIIDGDRFVGNNLSIPPELSTLLNLERLQLRNCQITALPESFGQLSKLNHLELGFNDLTALPASFSQLHELRIAKIANNDIHTLPPNWRAFTELIELDLEYNNITELPNGFEQLHQLKRIRLLGNAFSREEKKRIRDVFSHIYIAI